MSSSAVHLHRTDSSHSAAIKKKKRPNIKHTHAHTNSSCGIHTCAGQKCSKIIIRTLWNECGAGMEINKKKYILMRQARKVSSRQLFLAPPTRHRASHIHVHLYVCMRVCMFVWHCWAAHEWHSRSVATLALIIRIHKDAYVHIFMTICSALSCDKWKSRQCLWRRQSQRSQSVTHSAGNKRNVSYTFK